MTNYEKFGSMNKKELAKWLADYVEYDGTPWERWYSKNFCDNCESIMVKNEDWHKECPAAYCEIYEKCRFFPEIDHNPTIAEGIEMWLEEEAKDNLEYV